MNGFVKAGRPFGRIRDTLTDGRAAGPLMTGRHGQGAGDGADEAKRLAPMRISPRGGHLMQRAVRLGELSAPWAIACALPQREGHAEAELARAGFEAYCPREIVHAGNFSKRREVERPLFPRYIFFRGFPGHGEALACGSLHSILPHGDGTWARVAHGLVAALAAAESAGDLHAAGKARLRRRAVSPGDSVRITGGALAGWAATVIAVTPDKRLTLLVNMLGRETRATLPFDKIEI